MNIKCSWQDKVSRQTGIKQGERLSGHAMKIKRQEKSNLVGRIRKIFMKEMMFDMWEISGNVTGTNSTGRPVSTWWMLKTLTHQSRSPHPLWGDGPFSSHPCFPITLNLPPLCHLLHWICLPMYLLHWVTSSSWEEKPCFVMDAKVPENAENLEPREFYIHLL